MAAGELYNNNSHRINNSYRINVYRFGAF